ncbi:MAG: arginine N-succinyltransferase, partial [Pseudomonadota bacterium]
MVDLEQADQLVLRAATPDDLAACMALSGKVGTGMTSMPMDEARWQDRLQRTSENFAATEPKMV